MNEPLAPLCSFAYRVEHCIEHRIENPFRSIVAGRTHPGRLLAAALALTVGFALHADLWPAAERPGDPARAGTISSWIVSVAEAREASEPPLLSMPPSFDDLPASAATARTRAFGDTLFYGYYDGTTGLALSGYPRGGAGHTWTFDHGASDPFEGWYATDVTANITAYGRHIDSVVWAGGSNLVAAPILSGAGSAWIGAFESEADQLCWNAGLGYGNSWCQRLTSPPIAYGGGGASLSFLYFNDTEPEYDFTRMLLRRPDGAEVSLNGDGFDGEIGLAPDHPASTPTGATFVTAIEDTDLGGFTSFQLVFEFDSDGGWSDADGDYPTEYGPLGFDDLTLTGAAAASFAFETSLEGWTPAVCAGFGTFFGVNDVAAYTLQDPCACTLSGKVLEFHDDSFEHPYGQRVVARSNPVDLTGAGAQLNGSPGALDIGAYWSQYSELPYSNGVFYRVRWQYYPYPCVITGGVRWSPPTTAPMYFWNEDLCGSYLSSATGQGVPNDPEQVRFLYELYASCDAFGIPPTDCSNVTNFTPIIDNINVFATGDFDVPNISFESGRRYQDGFGRGAIPLITIPGNADCSRNQNGGNTQPILLEDVPQVNGPLGVFNPWSARLHFRVAREGPGAEAPSFAEWQLWKVATGVGVGAGSAFAYGVMDTVETVAGPVPNRDRYEGYYREDDPNNPSPGTERLDDNEIIVDNVPPGTKIEYFVSAKFNASSGEALLPDTTGGNFAEFEILPSWRDVEGVARFPAVLYVDVGGSHVDHLEAARRQRIEEALGLVLGAPDAGDLRAWDRFDYRAGSSGSPLAQGNAGSNNGVPLAQLLGYRMVMVETGVHDSGMWPEDFLLLDSWLTAAVCGGNSARQGLLLSGDGIGTLAKELGPGLLNNRMGADLRSSSYRDLAANGGDCVGVETAGGASYPTINTMNGVYSYDAWGNGCAGGFEFDVLDPYGTGVGNRTYVDVATGQAWHYAQIVNAVSSPSEGDFRAVISGVSAFHTAEPHGPIGDPNLECAPDATAIVTAIANELAAAKEWVFDTSLPPWGGVTCIPNSVGDPVGVSSAQVSHLGSIVPNPFNPRTELRFSLGVDGRASLAIFDTAGRLVRTLVDETLLAGQHRITWDGTDDRGNRLAAGVYWSQLTAPDGYASSKRMVLLR